MKMFKMLMLVISGLLMVATLNHPGQAVNQSTKLLDRQFKGANLRDVMIGQAVINALLDAGAPGGVARVSDCNEWDTHTFTPRDTTLRGVLDSIVSTDPRYTWEVKDDVINVLPSNGLPPFFAVRISRFEVPRLESPNEALSRLLAVPEVQQALLSLGPRAVQGGTYGFCPKRPAKDTKRFQSV